MHVHLLFDHPLFDEKPVKDILEPFGFLVHIDTHELPNDLDGGSEYERYQANPDAYIDQLENTAPVGYTEIARQENEDGIIIASVLAKHVFAQLLLGADTLYAGGNSRTARPFADVHHERMRQITLEEFSRERDDHWQAGELALAAATYAISAAPADALNDEDLLADTMESIWPWEATWLKPTDPRRDLVKAGALIAAEIERLDRAAAKAEAAGGDA